MSNSLIYLILCIVPLIFAGIATVIIVSRRIEIPPNTSNQPGSAKRWVANTEQNDQAAQDKAPARFYKGSQK